MGKNFTPLRSSRKTICVDRQTIKVQELCDSTLELGRVPRTLECELTEELCDTLLPGDVARLTGVVKVVTCQEQQRRKEKQYLLFLSTLSIASPRTKDSRTSTLGISFTQQDYQMVQEVHSYGSGALKLLVASLCPSIYGHRLVKAGLLLGLFGGTCRGMDTAFPVRGDPHILVVGDPGLGKSQMLGAVVSVAPRGVAVTGNTSTTGGLTVTLTRESGSDFALDAGALVLADQGCCCIDEFDKMSGQHAALLEAMEQQQISVAKAGVVCTLPARTAIIARFDLVFILIDKPDEEQDERLTEHVMALHSKHLGNQVATFQTRGGSAQTLAGTQGIGQLAERLAPSPGENEDPLPQPLLRKYIAYARRYVHPKLGEASKQVLQNFYLELRAKPQAEATPITTRQLESLIRLTEARARMELREETTKADAEEVVEIMRSSMIDTFTDDIGQLDFSRSAMGSGMSSRGAAKKFLRAVELQAQRQQKKRFSVDELKQIATTAGVRVPSFHELLEKLNHQGFLLQKGQREYQIVPAEM